MNEFYPDPSMISPSFTFTLEHGHYKSFAFLDVKVRKHTFNHSKPDHIDGYPHFKSHDTKHEKFAITKIWCNRMDANVKNKHKLQKQVQNILLLDAFPMKFSRKVAKKSVYLRNIPFKSFFACVLFVKLLIKINVFLV